MAKSPLAAPLVAGVVGLAVQLLYLLTLSSGELAGLGSIRDSAFYDMRASEIATGNVLGHFAEYLSPFYCLVLAGMKILGLESLAAMRFAQAFLAALCCALTAHLAARWFGRREAFLAGVGFALYPPFTYYAAQLLPTTLVVLSNLAILAAYPPPDSRHRVWRLALAGVAAGCAALTKSNAILLIGALALGHVMASWKGRRGRGALEAFVLCAAALATIAPVTAKNALLTGQLVPISTTTGVNLYKGNGPPANGTHVFIERRGAGLKAHLRGDAAQDPAAVVRASEEMRRETLEFMAENPKRTALLFLRKLHFFMHSRELFVRDDYPRARRGSLFLAFPYLNYGLLVMLAGASLFVIPWRWEHWPLGATLLVQAASFTLVFVLARYRMVTAALLFVLLAAGLVAFLRRVEQREWRRLLAALATALLLALFAFWPLPAPTAPPPDSAPSLSSADSTPEGLLVLTGSEES